MFAVFRFLVRNQSSGQIKVLKSMVQAERLMDYQTYCNSWKSIWRFSRYFTHNLAFSTLYFICGHKISTTRRKWTYAEVSLVTFMCSVLPWYSPVYTCSVPILPINWDCRWFHYQECAFLQLSDTQFVYCPPTHPKISSSFGFTPCLLSHC